MTVLDETLDQVVQHFLWSAEREHYNGLIAKSLLKIVPNENELRAILVDLARSRSIDCVFSKYAVNIHIKRMPDLPAAEQMEYIAVEDLRSFCIYPTAREVQKNFDVATWNNKPFSKALLLAEPQLDYRAFEMAALERYLNDPRYQVHFADYMGSMTIGDEAFREMGFPDRDKVALKTFGLGFGAGRLPYVILFLRYLANLSPEHQQFWNSYLADCKVLMTSQYYDASFGAQFWQNRSVRHAIVQEMQLINSMTRSIYGQNLFRDFDEKDVPIGITGFLRPTSANFEKFVLALDKLLSERIDTKFFDQKIDLYEEFDRGGGRFELQKKGSIRLLEEWLFSKLQWQDPDRAREVIVAPLREIRRLRQKPAHEFSADRFDLDFHDKRRNMLWKVFNSLQSIRATFSNHEAAKGIVVPKWLDEGRIDVL